MKFSPLKTSYSNIHNQSLMLKYEANTLGWMFGDNNTGLCLCLCLSLPVKKNFN